MSLRRADMHPSPFETDILCASAGTVSVASDASLVLMDPLPAVTAIINSGGADVTLIGTQLRGWLYGVGATPSLFTVNGTITGDLRVANPTARLRVCLLCVPPSRCGCSILIVR